jgi:predicted permease
MRTLRRFLSRLAALAGRRDESRLQEEIEEHIALATRDNLRAGLPPAEARRQALLRFGGVEAVKEDYRDARGLPFLETAFQDVRYALRQLRRSPGFASAAVLTLALGIGATTSIFTLVDQVLFKSLPVANPSRLYRVGNQSHCCSYFGYSQSGEFSIFSYDLYLHLRDHTEGFEQLAAFEAGMDDLGVRRVGSSHPAERYFGEFVSGNYFSMFGLGAYAGRAISPSDDRPGAPPVAVMSYRLWSQKYALDPSVAGSVFFFNSKPFTVVGIAPPGFFGDTLRTTPPDFFLPLAAEPLITGDGSALHLPAAHWLDLIGRLRPGVNPVSIEAQMRVGLRQWLDSHLADMNPNQRTRIARQTLYLRPGGTGISSMREAYERWLRILAAVSGIVLLLVCANVANLMLVRGLERRLETSLAMALGARPFRLVRRALTESLMLSVLGGSAGIAVALAGTRLILHFAFPGSTASPLSAAPSLPVLAFALAVSLVTGIAFGIAPAWMATRVEPIEALRGANRATRHSAAWPRKALVILQAALSLVLLSGAGMFTKSLRHLEDQDFGFDQDGRTIVNINPRQAGYRADQLDLLYRRLHDSLAEVPGVASAAFATYSPFAADGWNAFVYVQGRPAPGPSETNVAWIDRVTPGYFEAIGNRILAGRAITEQDTATSPHVAVVNEAFARKFFGKENPVGRHFGSGEIENSGEFEIAGVARDARYSTYDMNQPVPPFFFLPESQTSVYRSQAYNSGDASQHFLHDIVIVTAPGARLDADAVRRAIASVDPNLPVAWIQTLRQQVAANFSNERLVAQLTSLFGILALVLASIGLYGVTAFNTASRTAEIGVRLALGARRSSVLGLILRGALSLVGLGLVAGFGLSLAAARLLGSQLFGVNQYDPAVLALAVFALGSAGFAAALVPALRASSIAPIEALRSE